jgi:glutamate-1-semialdehyde 2,1-aminomutase
LALLDDTAYALLEARATRLAAVLTDACVAAGLSACFPRTGTLVGMFFGANTAPTNFVEAKTTDEQMYRLFFHAMLAEGVALAPGAYEALFVGLAHDESVLDTVAEAATKAAAATAAQLG